MTAIYNKCKRNAAKKLTEAAVIDIMTDKVSTPKQMAARHNVATTQIYDIHKGKTWKHISLDPKYTPRIFKRPQQKLNAEIVTAIKHGEITDFKSVANEYGVAVKYLKSLLIENRYNCWKTIRVKDEVKSMKTGQKKLTDQQVIEIMLDKTSSFTELGKKYGIHPKSVYKLRAGEVHKNITLDPKYKYEKRMYRRINNKTKKFTDDQVIKIINDHETDIDVLAQLYGVGRKAIQNIYTGRTYKYITCNPEYANNRRVFTCRKLNEDIVRAIKNNERTDFEDMAKEYGVSVKHLKQLRNPNNTGSWKYLPTPGNYTKKVKTRKKLTDAEVIGIISHVEGQVKVIARNYSVHPKTVSNLRTGRMKKHITLDLNYNKWLEARNVKASQNQGCFA